MEETCIKAADSMGNSDIKAADSTGGSTSDIKPVDNMGDSDKNSVDNMGGSDINSVDNMGGSAIKPVDNMGGSDINSVDKMGGSDKKSVDNMGDSGVKPVDNMGSIDIKPVNDMGDSDIKSVDNMGSSDIKSVDNMGGSDIKPVDNMGGSVIQPADSMGNSDIKAAGSIGSSDIKPVDNMGVNGVKPVDNMGGSAIKPVNNMGGSDIKPVNNMGGSDIKPVDDMGGSVIKPADSIAGSGITPADNMREVSASRNKEDYAIPKRVIKHSSVKGETNGKELESNKDSDTCLELHNVTQYISQQKQSRVNEALCNVIPTSDKTIQTPEEGETFDLQEETRNSGHPSRKQKFLVFAKGIALSLGILLTVALVACTGIYHTLDTMENLGVNDVMVKNPLQPVTSEHSTFSSLKNLDKANFTYMSNFTVRNYREFCYSHGYLYFINSQKLRLEVYEANRKYQRKAWEIKPVTTDSTLTLKYFKGQPQSLFPINATHFMYATDEALYVADSSLDEKAEIAEGNFVKVHCDMQIHNQCVAVVKKGLLGISLQFYNASAPYGLLQELNLYPSVKCNINTIVFMGEVFMNCLERTHQVLELNIRSGNIEGYSYKFGFRPFFPIGVESNPPEAGVFQLVYVCQIDDSGWVLVADTTYHRLQVLDIHSTTSQRRWKVITGVRTEKVTDVQIVGDKMYTLSYNYYVDSWNGEWSLVTQYQVEWPD